MAGEATHIILADQFLADKAPHYDRKQFILGTVFPDIRYISDMERDMTHVREITVAHVLAERDPFVAGARFHSVVDTTRNDFIKGAGMYELCPPFLYDQQSLKFCEDELFYGEYQHWPEILAFLNTPPMIPAAYPVARDIVEKWYMVLEGYVATPPNDESRGHLLTAEGYTNEAIILINAYIDELKKNKAAVSLMREFFREFPRLM